MAIDHKMYLLSIDVFPTLNGMSNVVRKVAWCIEFFDTDFPDTVNSLAHVDTFLDTESIDPADFISVDDLTHTQVLTWAYEQQGGDAFLERIRPLQDQHLDHKRLVKDLVKYDIDLLAQE